MEQKLQHDLAISGAPEHYPPPPSQSLPRTRPAGNGETGTELGVALPPVESLVDSLPPTTGAAVPSIENTAPGPDAGPERDADTDDMTRAVVRPYHALAGILVHPPDRQRLTTSSSPSPPLSSAVPTGAVSAAHPADYRGSLSPPCVSSGTPRGTTPGSSTIGTSNAPSARGDDEVGRQQEQQAAAEQAEEGSIVVDGEELRGDAGYESDNAASASTSLAESMRDYIYENGRRYHRFREGRYNFPNDDVEQQREDMKHAMVKMLCGNKLFYAPIGKDPHEILDIGTGTGIWAMEMGDLFGSATVLGVDLSPIQPEWVPPNVRFMVDDVESPWLHPRNHFDFIHSRHTVMAIKDWPRLMMRSLEHLRPGGWFEIQEVFHSPLTGSTSLPLDHPVAQYWHLINEGLTRLGVQFHAVANGRMENMMRECGYVNVQEKMLKIPIGTWPKNKVLKTVGLYWRTILLDGIQAIALGPLTRGCGWSREEVELFLIQVRRAYHDNSCLAYMPLHILFGQKPTADC